MSLLARELSGRIGGPLGERAIRDGVWFSSSFWAVVAAWVTMTVAIIKQLPCRPLPGDFPNPYLRLCYSDIPTLYLNRNIGAGGLVYKDINLEYPPLIGYLIAATRWITSWFTEVGPHTDQATQVQASQIFLAVNALVAGLLFFVVVLVAVKLSTAQQRPWDSLLVAASPLVAANVLINWDMLALALTSLALLAWSRRHPALAGVLIGLGFATKFYPLLVGAAIVLVCCRAGKLRVAATFSFCVVGAWVGADLPLWLTTDGWRTFWRYNVERQADLGSIWYVLKLAGFQVPHLSAVSFFLMLSFGIGVVITVFHAPRRPRVSQVALLLVIIFLIFSKVYSPQYAMWLVPLVALARPQLFDVGVWTLAEMIYWFSIWGYLQGVLGSHTNAGWVYWAAVVLRISAQVWLASRVLDDIYNPWQDPIRQPFIDDPVGGVVDHSVDVIYLPERTQ